MDGIIKKTNLGIAIQEAISDLGLQREKSRMMLNLQRSFEEKFQQFKKTITLNNGNLKGMYVVDNQFPIGEQYKQQYFRSYAFKAAISGSNLTTTVNNEKRPFTLIEAYSKNDDSKKRQYSKAHSKAEKKASETGGKKKQKK